MSYKDDDALIIDCARTPMGRSKNGVFRHVRAEDLSADLVDALLARNPGVDPQAVEDVIWGCANQTEEQGWNIARMMSLLTVIPHSAGAQTISRLCGSSMSALHIAAQAVMHRTVARCSCRRRRRAHGAPADGQGHRSRTPVISKHVAKAAGLMGSHRRGAGHAARHHARAAGCLSACARTAWRPRAQDEGRWAREIIPVARRGHDEDGCSILVAAEDTTVRRDTTLEGLAALAARLRPAQRHRHRRYLVPDRRRCGGDDRHCPVVKARACGAAVRLREDPGDGRCVGVDPSIMGYGPVPATHKALARCRPGA
jgi:acetyl-CoA acyltransferase